MRKEIPAIRPSEREEPTNRVQSDELSSCGGLV
jgi:hypothetical protein